MNNKYTVVDIRYSTNAPLLVHNLYQTLITIFDFLWKLYYKYIQDIIPNVIDRIVE